MASGQTENYGLNQWAAEDAVLREEFNRDNAKLDTELDNLKTENVYVHLLTHIVPANAETVEIDLSEFDLTQFNKLELCCITSGGPIIMQVNNKTSGYYIGYSSNYNYLASLGQNGNNSAMPGQITLYFGDSNYIMSVFSSAPSAGSEPSLMYCTLSEALHTLKFSARESQYTIKAGSKFAIYGLRE